MILDASPVISFLQDEPAAADVRRRSKAADHLVMSTVNLGEVLMFLHRMAPDTIEIALSQMERLGIEFIPPDYATTLVAASARRAMKLNFGDTFCYALAKRRGEPILTLDADFAKTDAALVALQ